MSNLKSLLLVSLIYLLAACAATESKNVKTEGIYADFTISEAGGGVRASATFYVGDDESAKNGTVLELSDGDSVEVNGQELAYNKDFFGKIQYQKTMNYQRFFTFVFRRAVADGPDEKYEAEVELPETVILTSPKNFNSFRRGTPIPVRWRASRTGDYVNVAITGTGTSADGGGDRSFTSMQTKIEDDGLHTLSSNDTNPSTIRGNIHNVEITVQRVRRGNMTRGLNGEISGMTQSKVTDLTLTK